MNPFAAFAGIIFAAESVLSPIPDDMAPDRVSPLPYSYDQTTVIHQTTMGSLIHSPVLSQISDNVLGMATTAAVVAPVSVSSPSATPAASPTAEIRLSKKPVVTVAFLGDSMVDTLGPEAPQFVSEIKKFYPKTEFRIINYGAGGENLESAIRRIASDHTYLGTTYPPLSTKKPDIVVLESCGYNPMPNEDSSLNHDWLTLSQAVDSLRANIPGAKIVIAATIAPNSTVFGDGAPAISFSRQDKMERTTLIKKYLENAVRFGKSQKLPVADAYHPSLGKDGDGKIELINPGDHIHYSDAGRLFFGRTVAKTILDARLLE